jgi:RNase adaptor protein for sRNA GlmZ degradation
VDAVITSFGYLHGPAPVADVTVDVRAHLRDPHLDSAMRELTGMHQAVRQHVLACADRVVLGLVIMFRELLSVTANPPVTVAVGCAGGRHRSVVIAEEVARRLRRCDWQVQVHHVHIDRPVVRR